MGEEISFTSVGTLATDDIYSAPVEEVPLGIKTPLQLGSGRSGIFQMHFDVEDQIQDNLKNLLLTNHGERLGLFKYGANLRKLVSERTSKEDFDGEAMLSIKNTVATYMPFVEPMTFESTITTIDASKGLAKVTISMKYNVEQLRIRDKAIAINIHTMG
jgi:phage baseplate assembly protein W